MARGNSKLGGFGRGRRNDEQTGPNAAWPSDGPDATTAPAAPSPARNILPGEPFEPLAPGFPAPRSPEPASFAATTPAGWGSAPVSAGVGALTEPGLLTSDAFGAGWPGDVSTHPMPAVPVHGLPGAGFPGDAPGFGAAGDPLDALQQYAGLPVGGAPAPDPSQLYPMPPHASALPTDPSGATPSGAAPVDSGFADGGIFTGADLPGSEAHASYPGFPAAPPAASAFPGLPTQTHPHGAGLHGGFDAQAPSTDFVPQRNLEPLGYGDVLPGADSGRWPDSDRHPDSDLDGEDGHRRGRRRSRHESGRRRAGDSGSSSGSRRAVALLGAVAVLGAAGYLGYSQLSGSSDEALTVAPAPVKPAATARYPLPTQLSNLSEITPAQVKELTASYTQLSAQNNPDLPAPLTATAYHPQNSAAPVVNAVVYKPASATVYNALVASLSRPGAGSAAVAGVPVAPGAAGGTMMCGSQRGASPSAWCAWNSPKGLGFVQAKGTANPTFAAIYTRELRAYAER